MTSAKWSFVCVECGPSESPCRHWEPSARDAVGLLGGLFEKMKSVVEENTRLQMDLQASESSRKGLVDELVDVKKQLKHALAELGIHHSPLKYFQTPEEAIQAAEDGTAFEEEKPEAEKKE